MQTKSLQSFICIAEAGSFTKAAGLLYVSQPALLWEINALEKELDFSLFTRSPRGVQLTRAGEEFYKYAKEILRLSDEALLHCRALEEKNQPCIRVGLISYIPDTILNRVCSAYRKLYPEVELQILDVDFFDRRKEVAQGKLDVTETSDSRVIKDLGLDFLPLIRDLPYCAISPEHPLAKKKLLRLSDLEGETLAISNEKHDYINDCLQQSVHEQGLDIRFAEISYKDNPFSRSAILGSIAVMPACMAQVCHPLIPIPLDFGVFLEMGLLSRPQADPALKNFLDLAKQLYSENKS